MKNISTILLTAFLFASCEIVIVEPYDPRDEIVGSYNLTEYSETYNMEMTFPISIYKVGNDYESLRIGNFYDVGINVHAHLNGNKIHIPFQVVDMFEISGIGTLHSNEISFSYSVYDQISDSYVDYCYATAW